MGIFKKGNDNKDEEIMSMIDEYKEQGALEEDEAEMIGNVIEWSDSLAKDIMTNRALVDGVEVSEGLKEGMLHMLHGNNSRYPLYEENFDNILGILYLKDVMLAFLENDGKSLSDIARKPFFVPETLKLDALFSKMRSSKVQMAVVVDEYGQNAGIVTMEDILEEIVGEIQDEYDDEDVDARKAGEDLIVEGTVTLEELEALLPITILPEDLENFDTLNGLLLRELGHIPEDGENGEIRYAGYLFYLTECKDCRIETVRIRKAPVELTEVTSEDKPEK